MKRWLYEKGKAIVTKTGVVKVTSNNIHLISIHNFTNNIFHQSAKNQLWLVLLQLVLGFVSCFLLLSSIRNLFGTLSTHLINETSIHLFSFRTHHRQRRLSTQRIIQPQPDQSAQTAVVRS